MSTDNIDQLKNEISILEQRIRETDELLQKELKRRYPEGTEFLMFHTEEPDPANEVLEVLPLDSVPIEYDMLKIPGEERVILTEEQRRAEIEARLYEIEARRRETQQSLKDKGRETLEKSAKIVEEFKTGKIPDKCEERCYNGETAQPVITKDLLVVLQMDLEHMKKTLEEKKVQVNRMERKEKKEEEEQRDVPDNQCLCGPWERIWIKIKSYFTLNNWNLIRLALILVIIAIMVVFYMLWQTLPRKRYATGMGATSSYDTGYDTGLGSMQNYGQTFQPNIITESSSLGYPGDFLNYQ